MPDSVPHHCPACLEHGACGYNGKLSYVGRDAPVCDHDIQTPKEDLKAGQRSAPCHPDPVEMVCSGDRNGPC